ncbi:O-antigen ligase family protein [Rhizobium sp. RU20A]|uniref:O-antigen ligase family protein n=1 Tax=Rhizobium sp. RU20A TaxID=1907412 RepID=UPI00165F4679|nr:O-antigen ligase family protein [Rhizobium sp. RU20A]
MIGETNSIRYKTNGFLMWAVTAIVLVMPLFLGANRPGVWALTAALLFATASLYFLRLALAGVTPRKSVSAFPLIWGLFLALTVYIAIQFLPVARLLPGALLWWPADVPASATISVSPGDTLFALLRWLSYGLLFYMAVQIAANRTRAATFLSVMYVVVVLHAAYGAIMLLQFNDTILFSEKWSYEGSATGAFVNRNSFATFLAFGCVLGVSLILEELFTPIERRPQSTGFRYGSNRNLILNLTGLAIIASVLVMTNSRMGNFVALAGVLVVSLMAIAKSDTVRGRYSALAAVVLASFGLLLALYGGGLLERVGAVGTDADTRLSLYKQAIEMIAARPLTGFGGSSFEYAYPLFHQLPVSTDFLWDKAHNSYLTLWVEYGLLFGSIPMLILAIIAWRLVRAFAAAPFVEAPMLAGSGVIIVGALHSLVDFSLEIQGVTMLFVVIVGAGFAYAVQSERRATRD